MSYELEVSPTDQFTVLTLDIATVKGTQYSPPTTIDNGAYFWRVRARNQAGAVGAWSEVSTFQRAWPAPDSGPNHRVTLLAPADNDVSVGLPEFTLDARAPRVDSTRSSSATTPSSPPARSSRARPSTPRSSP